MLVHLEFMFKIHLLVAHCFALIWVLHKAKGWHVVDAQQKDTDKNADTWGSQGLK